MRPNVVIDMTAVQFMDSSCLRKLVHMYQERATGHGFSPARLGPWVAALENELIDFPTGAHDDQVDVLSDARDVVAQAMNRPSPQTRGVVG